MEVKEIASYREKIDKGNPSLILDRPCREGDGILCLSKEDQQAMLKLANSVKKEIKSFIPASGSGSRMFSFLFQYLNKADEKTTSQTEHFFSQIKDLAIYHFLPKSMRISIEKGDYDTDEVLRYILGENGMNLGSSPKALVPFHFHAPVVFNALQEQILQAQNIHSQLTGVHFTTQEEYQNDFEGSISALSKLVNIHLKIDYSAQAKETNSLALDDQLNPVLDSKGEYIERPAGHGALLRNLDSLKADYIFVKNIDNVQHWDHHQLSKKWWNVLLGTIEMARMQMKQVLETENWSAFESINDYFQFVPDSTWRNWDSSELIAFLNRPIRVCGMVKNVGQPGGGPYWVSENGSFTKQIVEKAQISEDESQRRIMIRSTHFNPVMLVLCPNDLNDNHLDLNNFVDDSKYFVVEKTHEGQNIKYMELPGLWNGGMGNWNTIFVEVPIQTFSPVKSVVDLLDPLHQAKTKD
ncbi:MAG: DUF4301 family protein [Bacteroidetes bacterium]|nr:DUF4301 family protein [Bacteroidota bacterium]